jgi:hypothetical protein
MVKLGVARGDVSAQRVGAILGQQVLAFALDTEVGAEVAATVHHVAGVVIQIGRARVLELGCAIAGPWQAKVVAGKVVTGFLVLAGLGLERLDIEQMHVAHVRLQALRALTGVADGPDRAVDLAQDVLGHRLVHALDLLHLEIFGQLLVKAELFGELLHDHVVAAAFP